MIELLAPAKDKICAKAAIDFGADAIYIGASEFGARKNAPNSLFDIEEIIQYAHKFNVKVYVTVNTILTDEEIIRAKELIQELYEIGVDAIIIQDMGLLEIDLPPIEVHASTQCDIRTPQKAKFLESAGCSRLILARELSIEQIREIKNQTSAELEVFIHGALCVSYSGQCYLSQLIGNRSANRGQCAQPCRKKYSLVDEEGNYLAKDKYLLSLKDFNASKHLQDLIDAGVTSFKIEGRLKDENYVKNVVAFYRKKLDELGCERASSGKILLDFEPALEKTFNRGFTDYFLKNNTRKQKENIYNFDTPKAKGEFIGKVTKIGDNYFEIKGSAVHAQDGLCFSVNDEFSGCLVNKVDEVEAFRSGSFGTVQKIFPYKMDGIAVGKEIYRNFDAEFEKTLKNSKTCRKVSANIEFDLGRLKVTDEDGNSVEIKYIFEEMAQNHEKMRENILNQLKKTGDTDFLIEDVKINTQKIPFLPLSKLNEIRRELIEKLMAECLVNYEKGSGAPISNKREVANYPLTEVDYKGNILNSFAKAFYEHHGCKVVEGAIEGVGCVGKTSKRVAMITKHCLKRAFGLCQSEKKLFLTDDKNKRYELKFDCDKCEMEIIF